MSDEDLFLVLVVGGRRFVGATTTCKLQMDLDRICLMNLIADH